MHSGGAECKGKRWEWLIVKKIYLKCQFFSKKRAYFSKRRAYFSVSCHFINCIFMQLLANGSVLVSLPTVHHRCRKWCNYRCKITV